MSEGTVEGRGWSSLPLSRKLDWIFAVGFLLVGVVLVVWDWPSPGWMAWSSFAAGIAGFVLAFFNPMGRVNTWIKSRMLRKRR